MIFCPVPPSPVALTFNSADCSYRFGHDGRFNLQLRGEFFNVANHVRFGFPGLAFGNATFGVVSTQSNVPRQVQVAAKFLF